MEEIIILPGEYQQVEYIESHGEEYINTGVKANSNIKMEVTLINPDMSDSDDHTLCGGGVAWGEQYLQLQCRLNSMCSYGDNWDRVDFHGGNITIICQDKNNFYQDGELLSTFSPQQFNTNYDIHIFCAAQSNVPAEFSSFKVAGFKIYNDNNLVRDFIACVRVTDGEAGLYDLVTETFFTNEGSGAFTYPDTPVDNRLSQNLERIRQATNDIRSITGTDNDEIEIVAQAVSDLNDESLAKDQEIADLEDEIERITPKGTIDITDNGTINVSQYASANVNVSGGGGDGIYKVSSINDLINNNRKAGPTYQLNDIALATDKQEIPLLWELRQGNVLTSVTFPAIIDLDFQFSDWGNYEIEFEDDGSGWGPRLSLSCSSNGLQIYYDSMDNFFMLEYISEDGQTYISQDGEQTLNINKIITYIYGEQTCEVFLEKMYITDIHTDGLYQYNEIMASALTLLNNKGPYYITNTLWGAPMFIYNVQIDGNVISSLDFVCVGIHSSGDYVRLYKKNNKFYLRLLEDKGNVSIDKCHYDRATSTQWIVDYVPTYGEDFCLSDVIGEILSNNWCYCMLDENLYNQYISNNDMSIYNDDFSTILYTLQLFNPDQYNLWLPLALGLTTPNSSIESGSRALTDYGVIEGTLGQVNRDTDILKYNEMCKNIINYPIVANELFSALRSEDDLPITKLLNTSIMTSMNHMFYNQTNLTKLDVSNFNTDNVTDMSYMFFNCIQLSELDVSNFDVSSVTDMTNMFAQCNSLTSLNLGDWDISNVTSMSDMFRSLFVIPYLDLSSWGETGVTDMSNMFAYCRGLTKLDLSNFYTTQDVKMNLFLNACSKLEVLDLRSFNFNKIINYDYMFGFPSQGIVPYDCLIIVRDQEQKAWMSNHFNSYINVKTVAEYEGGNN